jgi:hypothetical protein
MSDLSNAFERILAQFRKLDRRLTSALRNGVSEDELAQAENKLSLCLPAEVRQFFHICNGTNAPTGVSLLELEFFPGYLICSLHTSIDIAIQGRIAHRKLHSLGVPLDELESTAIRLGIPVFANECGSYFCVLCDTNGPNPVVEIRAKGEGSSIVYVGLTEMILSIAECYEGGAYSIDENGLLRTDYELEASIARRNNPGVQYWV